MSNGARNIMVDLIQSSDDKTLGSSKFFRSKWHLGRIIFSDFMDIVMYHISLQPDLDGIGKIRISDFSNLLKDLWEKKFSEKFYDDFGHPWINNDGYSSGFGIDYFRSNPGLELHSEFLLEYFGYPEALKGLSRHTRWPEYKEQIENFIFPKYRRIKHKKMLNAALDFAENVCQELRGKDR